MLCVVQCERCLVKWKVYSKVSAVLYSTRCRSTSNVKRKSKSCVLCVVQGGTFTISNLGMFGIKHFSAVINPPQVRTASLAQWLRCTPREWKIQGSIPACAVGIFCGQVTFKIGTSEASLPGAWRYRVRVGTGWFGVSIL